MEFSVLMSVYKNDNAEYFKRAVESVTVLQSVKPAYLVLVCDGPVPFDAQDISEKLCERAGTQLIFLQKEKNEGLAAALNDGIDLCKTEWIARMDADDIAIPQRFEKQIEYILAHPETDVLGSHIAEFENEPGDMDSERRVGILHEEISCMAKRRTPMNHISVFYKKSALLQVGKYDINFGKLEDYKLWVDLLASGKRFANIDDVLVFARVGNGFIERRSNKREIYDWDMLQVYLLSKGFVTKKEALLNKAFIRAFIYMPAFLKKIAYKFILRK